MGFGTCVEDYDPKTRAERSDGVGLTEQGEDTSRAPAQSPAAPASVEPSPSAPPEVETPQAASTSRSVADLSKARGRSSRVSPKARVAIAIAGSAAALVGVVAASLAVGGSARAPSPPASAASLAASLSGIEPSADGAVLDAPAEGTWDAAAVRVPVWRVSQLADDSSVTLVEVVIDHRPLLVALGAAKVSKSESQRVTRSLAEARDVDHFGAKDALTIALDKETHHVVAYELSTSPTEVWQAREATMPDGTTQLPARKLDLEIEHVRVGKSVVVGADLRASFVEAGLTPIDEVLTMLDDALEGHAELSDIRPGARLRLIATQERVDGTFVRWASLDAVEYLPATPNAPTVRVYRFGEGEETGEESGPVKKHRGWYDSKGRQPYHGGWRSPVPLARIASRFNPHRMHPVLHVVMPHNGVDFAAPIGAPVYASAAGTVVSIGNDGPCGNKVEIEHPGGYTSVYCHLSRYASGLRVGQHVEQRQLIAYVGQTGRVTGPHLHFGIKHNGAFIDPMTLRLDGVHLVPRAQRDAFDRHRGELDVELDGIPLPAAGPAPADTNEPDNFYEEP
jgi:murein DD-endopeptidase MepM/ murein hydrolase activator NlpD